MPLGDADLVLCSGTLPPGTTLEERVRAASAAGFRAVSLWGRDLGPDAVDRRRLTSARRMIEDHGLEVAEMDPVWWWTPGAPPKVEDPTLDPLGVFRFGELELFEMAETLGARSVNAADVFGGTWGLEQAAEAFARLCDRAAEHGLLVHLEWLAWSKLPDLQSAWAVVRAADRPNGGINVDTWHCARTGTTPDDLARLDGARVLAVQVSDGPARPEDELIHATLHERLLPGEGAFDLVGLLGGLRRSGVNAPVGAEVFSDDLHVLGPQVAAARAAAATRSVLEASGWSSPGRGAA